MTHPPARHSRRKRGEDVTCHICGRTVPFTSAMPGAMVRPYLVDLIRKDYPDWSEHSFICMDDMNRFRMKHVEAVVHNEVGDLASIGDLTKQMSHEQLFSKPTSDQPETVGNRLADGIAKFGGSWRFIIAFGIVLFSWITINAIALFKPTFDPYPFILLNLVLSCLAAIQAPIIMMSQNRQEIKDRERAENDYYINLRAELEIRHLHEKIDHLLRDQWERLVEIQQVQIDLLEEMQHKSAPSSSTKQPQG